MTVRVVISLEIEGDGPTETSLRESCDWLNKHGQNTSDYHEVIAHLAVLGARIHWRDSDRIRDLDHQRDVRLDRAAQRRRTREAAEQRTPDGKETHPRA